MKLQFMLQQLFWVAGRDLRPELVEQLDTLRQAAAMLGEENETLRKAVAAEMSRPSSTRSRASSAAGAGEGW